MDRREALKQSALLMGVTFSGTVFTGMLQGCSVDPSYDWQPLFLSPEQGAMIGEFAEHTLPKSDTPGAKDVLVDRFIDKLAAETFIEEDKREFLEGINEIEEKCQEIAGKSFLKMSTEERNKLFDSYDSQGSINARSVWGNTVVEGYEPSFFHKLKGLVLFGYFSSELIGEEHLSYDPIPGKFVGCVPLEEIGNSWSL